MNWCLGLPAALAILTAAAVGGPAAGAPEKALLQPPRETKDRLTPGRMEDLAGAFIGLIDKGGLAKAEAALGKQLVKIRSAKGPGSVEEADLLTSFAVLLYVRGLDEEDDALRRATLPYLDASVAVYRAALGPTDPYVAVALNSRADVLLALNGEAPTPAAVADLEEALRIREAALGPTNIETLATRKRLAMLKAHPSQGQDKRAKMAALEADFAGILLDSRNDPADGYEATPMMRMSLARAFAELGEGERAVAEANAALAMMQGWPAREVCLGMIAVVMLAGTLEEAGLPIAGLSVPVDRPDAVLRCVELQR